MENTVITTTAAAIAYIFGGKATVTLESTVSGRHFTYRVRFSGADGARPVYFVSLLTGGDSTYSYLGIVPWSTVDDGDPRFITTKKSCARDDAPSVKAFRWAIERLAGEEMPSSLRVHHNGRCGRCGKELTTPESLERGLGPVCAGAGI